MEEKGQIARSAGVIGLSTLASRVLGLVRDITLTHFFGSGMVAEAFNVAFMIPNLLRRLVGEGSLTVAFISVFTKLKQEEGEDASRHFAATFWMIMTGGLLVLTALGMYFSREIVTLFTNPEYRLKAGQFELAVAMNREMFPYLFMIGLVGLSMGIFNSHKRFFEPAFHPVLQNLALIAAVTGLHKWLGGSGVSLVIGVLAGGFLQLALHFPYLLKLSRAAWLKMNFRHPALKRIGIILLPSWLAVGIVQINTIIATWFVTEFDGARSQLFYANHLSEFPYAIFTLAIATAILPALSEQAGKGDRKAFADTLGFGFRLTAFIMVPASIGVALIARPFIHVAFEHGEFTAQDTADTALMLTMICAGMWAVTGHRIVVQAYYAVEDMVTPVIGSAVGLLSNLALCWLLARELGRAGVPLAISIATILNFLFLCALLPGKAAVPPMGPVLRSIGLALVASVPMAAAIMALNRLPLWATPGNTALKAAALLFEVAAGSVLYFIAAHFLRVPETKTMLDIFKRKVLRRFVR